MAKTWTQLGRVEKGSDVRRFHFTQKLIDGIRAEGKRTQFYDVSTSGLAVRVEPNGKKVYAWIRKVQGRPVFKSIGPVQDVTLVKAREFASEQNGKLAEYKRHGFRTDNPFESARAELTLGEVVDLYITKRVMIHAAHPETAKANVEWMMSRYLPDWKGRKLGAIRDKDVRDRHAKLGAENGRSMADRVMQLVRRVYFWAIKKEKLFSGQNPASGLSYFGDKKRERFLTADELARLFTALKDEPVADLRDYTLLSLFTGARKSDVLSMRWADVQLDNHAWKIPSPKGGESHSYGVPLVPEAIEVLEKRKKQANGHTYVFPSERTGGHLSDFRKRWDDLMVRAKIEGVTKHDLRRTFGSFQAGLPGASLPVIGRSLGHRSASSTAIYARLADEPVRRSVSLAVDAMLRQGKGRKLLGS